MPPEDNPADDIPITKEEWQAGEIERLLAENAELKAAIDSLEAGYVKEFERLRAEVELLTKHNEELNVDADRWNRMWCEKNEEFARLQQEVERLLNVCKVQVHNLECELAAKDAEIGRLYDALAPSCRLCGKTFFCDNGMWFTTCTCAKDRPEELKAMQDPSMCDEIERLRAEIERLTRENAELQEHVKEKETKPT